MEKMTLTIKKLKEMKEGIFATGTGTYPELVEDEVRWVAVRGGIHDWCIYYHHSYNDVQFVASQGDKIFTELIIKRLIPCDDEAYSMYRF